LLTLPAKLQRRFIVNTIFTLWVNLDKNLDFVDRLYVTLRVIYLHKTFPFAHCDLLQNIAPTFIYPANHECLR